MFNIYRGRWFKSIPSFYFVVNMKTFADFVIEKKILESDNFITEENLYEMARVQKKNSGLPQMIFVSTRDYGTGNHWARIKVSNVPGTFSKNDNFSVTVSKTPKVVGSTSKYSTSEMNDIFDWIVLNYDTLIKYWNNKYDSDGDFYNELKKI